jgi:hypothetical protein
MIKINHWRTNNLVRLWKLRERNKNKPKKIMVNTTHQGKRRIKEGAQASVGDDAVFVCVSMDEDYTP